MKSSEIAFLAALVSLMHGECTYVRTTHVRQVDGDCTLWSSPVVVFRLHEHGEAEECYAWCNHDEVGTPAPVVVLKTPGIESAGMAVRYYAAGLVRGMAARGEKSRGDTANLGEAPRSASAFDAA